MKQVSTNSKGQKDELIIKQDTQDGLLNALLKEYELTAQNIESINNRIFQFITVALAVLTFIVGYMVTQRPDVTNSNAVLLRYWLIGAWFVPLFCLTMYSILIFLGYILLTAMHNGRILSLRINTLVGESALLTQERMSVQARFFSTRTGSPKVRLLVIMLYVSAASLYPAIVSLAFITIYQTQGHLAGTFFVILYVFLAFLLLIAASGLIMELPQTYDKFINDYDGSNGYDGSQPIPYFDGEKPSPSRPSPSSVKRSVSAAKVAKAIFASLVPRPADVIVKGPFFIYGFVAALIITGLNSAHLGLLNTLFGEASTPWKSVATVPIWAIVAFCLLYFIVEEILLQQAKLIWDDIRDYKRDKKLLRNKKRAIASNLMSRSAAKGQLALRLLAALILGYLLGGLALLSVFLLICLHQILYVLWAKPRSASDPESKREQRELLFFVSLSVPLRFLAGVVAVTGAGWALSPYLLFYVLFYFCSFGAMAAFWKMEAEWTFSPYILYYVLLYLSSSGAMAAFWKTKVQYDESRLEQQRPQGEYYYNNGRFWQYVGLLAAVLVGACMVALQELALSCVPIVSNFYGGCSPRGVAHPYIDYGPLGILLVFFFILLFGIISWGLVRLFRPMGDAIAMLVNKAKAICTPLFFIGAVMTLFLFLPLGIWNSIFTLFLGFFLLNVGYFFMFEGMTLEQYTNEAFWKQLPNMKKAFGYLLFEPEKHIGLRRFIIVATSDADPDQWKNEGVGPPASTISSGSS